MNKRGITLVEFIVSIALISIVLLFLFNLLLDVQYTSNNNNFAIDNQLNRASILRNVMDDFNNLGLVGIREGNIDENTLELIFLFQDGSEKSLLVEEKKVRYGDELWSMKSKNSHTRYQVRCIPYEYISNMNSCEESECSDYFSVHFQIPVTIKYQNENIIDDLEFFYIGRKADLSEDAFPEKSYLGYQSSSCYQESNTINKIEKNT